MGVSQVKKSVRVLHWGDVWLDTPFDATSPQAAEKRRGELRQTFKKVMDTVRRQKIDVVLISGNLFDVRFATGDTANRLVAGFNSCPETRFFLSPGPSDPFAQESLYAAFDFPPNVTVFSQSKAKRVELPDLGLAVCGWAWQTEDDVFSPLSHGIPEGPEADVLVCGFAHPDGTDTVTVRDAELVAAAPLFAGLSDGGDFTGFQLVGDTVRANSGTPESRSYDYDGVGGVNLLLIDRDPVPYEEQEPDEDAPQKFLLRGGRVCVTVHHLPVGARRYVTAEADVSDCADREDMVRLVCRIVAEGRYGTDTSLRIVYVGHTDPSVTPPPLTEAEISQTAEFFTLDRTVPDKDEVGYARDMSIKGELVRAMTPLFVEKDEKGKEIAAKALRFTFAALDNQDTSHI